MNFKYALFDMDGTLLDSMSLWREGLLEYIRNRYGCIKHDADFSAEIINRSTRAGVALYKTRYTDDDTPDDVIIEIIRENTHNGYKRGCPVKPGAEKLIRHYNGCGVKTCLFTATPRFMVDDALKASKLDAHFDLIFTCDKPALSKEHTLGFKTALRELGAESVKEAILFEDALYSIKTAKSLGIYTVGVYDEYSKYDAEKIKETADEYHSSLDGFCKAHGIE